ncbi:hypothetical protein CR513_23770, partial [Mucuna pruriens]
MYISGGDDRLSCKLFPRTLRGVAMHWLAILPSRSIRTFNDLANSFASQFAANKTKELEVADLFDIKQNKSETLKRYLARFKNPTVRYVQKENEKTKINPRIAKKANERERPRETKEELRREKRRERSRSPQRRDIWRRGVITIISRGGDVLGIERGQKRKASDIMVIRERANQEPPPVISFEKKYMRYEPPRHDEPMSADMEPYARKLYGFVGEQVEIRGGIKLETMFGERSYAHTIPVLYTVVDVEASYNVIIGRPALNKLGAIVSTYHLCMKYPLGKEVGRVWADHRVARRYFKDNLRIDLRPAQADRSGVNVLDLDLDPDAMKCAKGPSNRGLAGN